MEYLAVSATPFAVRQKSLPRLMWSWVTVLGCVYGCGGSTVSHSSIQGVCIPSHGDLPPNWQAPRSIRFPHTGKPWSALEQRMSDAAVTKGFDEMVAFMAERPSRVNALWDNSVEAFIDTAYAEPSSSGLAQRAITLARKHLIALSKPYLGGESTSPSCVNVSEYLTLAVYARTLQRRRAGDERLDELYIRLRDGANLALDDCRTIEGLLGFDPRIALSDSKAANGDVYGWVMWSVTLLDALANPELRLPKGSARFVRDVWKYLSRYRVPLAKDYADGMNQSDVYDAAYLMTHVGYVPTGYGRHRLRVTDAPWLYRYLRENFYAAMQMGELDLFAEFVDLLRQYGCTESSDAQLRHGTRYLLSLYRQAGDSWLAHREHYEQKEISDYDALHKPWTAIAGLRRRFFEPVDKGSYRAAFERVMADEVDAR